MEIDDSNEHPADQICRIIQANPSVTLRNLTVRGDLEIEYDMRVDELRFDNVRFLGRFEVSGPKGKLDFQRVTFEQEADFYLSRPQDLQFNKCEFKAAANFHSVETNTFWLNGSKFRDHSVFVNMQVAELVNLADVVFEKSVDFSGATIGELNSTRLRSSEPIQIRWAQFGPVWLGNSYSWCLAVEGEDRTSRLRQQETALKFWRKNFASLGQQTDQTEVSYELVVLRRNYFTNKYSLQWWLNVLLEVPSRYGTRPLRPTFIALLMILIFGLIYWAVNPFVAPKPADALPNHPLLLFSLSYSLDTFVPVVNITGVKDWGWVISNDFRWLVLFEKVLGLTISVLAAYSISQTLLSDD